MDCVAVSLIYLIYISMFECALQAQSVVGGPRLIYFSCITLIGIPFSYEKHHQSRHFLPPHIILTLTDISSNSLCTA
jgi:hypothetical protein